MASIPLPALQVHPPEQQSNTMQMLQQVMQLKNAQQQNESGDLALQNQRMEVQSQQAIQKAYAEAKGDPDQTVKLAAQYGAKPQHIMALKNSLLEQQQKYATLGKDQQALFDAKTKAADESATKILSAPEAARPQLYATERARLIQAGVVPAEQLPEQYPGDQFVQQHQFVANTAIKLAADAKKAQNEAQGSKYKEVNGTLFDVSGEKPVPALSESMKPEDWTKLVDQIVPGKDNAALNARTKSEVAFYIRQGNATAAQKAITEAGNQVGSIEKEINPAVVNSKIAVAGAEARIQQAIKNGSAQDAGKMLAQGLIAPSEIAARSNPSFLVEANKAALALDPKYNAQRAEAEFKVASSASQSPFFGSAKSLTDKGGTLDQLVEQHAKLKNGKIPLFNKWEDYLSYQAGNPEMAGFMQTVIGTADDYAKVMGGGTGSDTSRLAVMHSFANAHNDAQMKSAVDAARAAVNSQINSRIGNNKVLRNMYAQPEETGTAGMTRIKASDGTFHDIPTANLDKAKKIDPGLQVQQ